jgi:hypothetical protein
LRSGELRAGEVEPAPRATRRSGARVSFLAPGAQRIVRLTSGAPRRRAHFRGHRAMQFLARGVQYHYADLKGDLEPMPRPQHSSTFIVPEAAPRVATSPKAPTVPRDARPFVIVPASMVIADDKLEPHWLPAIDAATD